VLGFALGSDTELADHPRQLLSRLERERVEEVVELDRQLFGRSREPPPVVDRLAGAVRDLEVGLLDERLHPEHDRGTLVEGDGVAPQFHLHLDRLRSAFEAPDLADRDSGHADLGVVDEVLRVGQRRRHPVATGDAGDGTTEVDPQHAEDEGHGAEEGGERRSPGPTQESRRSSHGVHGVITQRIVSAPAMTRPRRIGPLASSSWKIELPW
jgi:hypothetical protein